MAARSKCGHARTVRRLRKTKSDDDCQTIDIALYWIVGLLRSAGIWIYRSRARSVAAPHAARRPSDLHFVGFAIYTSGFWRHRRIVEFSLVDVESMRDGGCNWNDLSA